MVRRCTGCGNCVVICPPNWTKSPGISCSCFRLSYTVLRVVNGEARLLNFMLCDACKKCVPACPTGSIEQILKERDLKHAMLMRARRR